MIYVKVKITVDSREQNNKEIIKAFKKNKIDYTVQKIDEGDYSISIPEISHTCKAIIERKASLEEISANLCEPKDDNGYNRFERELIRAKEKGIKIILLIENPNWYEDMMRHNYRTRLKPKQFRGMLFSLCSKYNVTPVGVPREFVGSFIYNTLYYQLRDELKGMDMKI